MCVPVYFLVRVMDYYRIMDGEIFLQIQEIIRGAKNSLSLAQVWKCFSITRFLICYADGESFR